MTIETTLTKARFLGNGSARVFPLPYPVLKPEHIHLIVTDTATGRNTPVLAGYEIAGFEGSGVPDTTGVSVTYPITGTSLPGGTYLTIYREVPLVQELALQNASAFDAEVIEATFDNQEMQIQQLQEQMSRAVTVAISDTISPNDLRDSLFTAANSAAQSAAQGAASADAVAMDRQEVFAGIAQAEKKAADAAASADAAARSATEAAATATQGQPDASETAPGITRYGTAAEHLAGAQNVAATPDGVRKMIVATPASPTTPGLAKGDETTIVTGTGGVLSLLPGILLQGYETAGTFTFTCPNPWGNNKPLGAEVQIKGGGGGGSSGQLQSPRYYGGQGGSEGELVISKQQLTPGETYQVVIGAGGSGGTNAGSTSNPGSTGGTSAFKAVITAMGGIGGRPPAQLQIANNGVTSVSSQESHLKGFVGSIPYSNTSAIGFGTSGAGRNGGVFAGNTGTPGLAARGTFGCGGAGGGCDDALNSGFGGAGGDGFCYIFAIGGGI